MRKAILCLFLSASVLSGFAASREKPALLKLRYQENYSPEYEEVIAMYQMLDKAYPEARLIATGGTDCGRPFHTFVISKNRKFEPDKINREEISVVLINNGIHPGEPEGIDASLKFADDLLRNHDGMAAWLDHTVVVIIPVYNIGGALNRSAYNRSGQTTPYETGFRGNYGNQDLNRDFTKCDTRNARSFTEIFRRWDPDLFLDTHTTNGSNHQQAITLIPPQPDLFPPVMENFITSRLIPFLYEEMEKGPFGLIPYVDWIYEDVRSGLKGGQESPRYSSGYAARFHTYGMMTENLIYKPFPERVESTCDFIRALVKFSAGNGILLRKSREAAIRETLVLQHYPLSFMLDTTRIDTIRFLGYETDRQQISPMTGLARPGYDVSKPFEATLPYYSRYRVTDSIPVPEYYVVPQAWEQVRERLLLNGVEYTILPEDTLLSVTMDYIDECSHPARPYNGHFYHDKVVTHSERQKVRFYAGDWLIPVRQKPMRYIIEMLEPKAKDSFFRWNFFDAILDQREYFSPYGFEENAIKTLQEFPDLKRQLEEKKQSDPDFAASHYAQMAYIYNNSPWLEKTWKRYPIGKIFRDHLL